MSKKSNSQQPGGYENLIVYQQAVVIFDLSHQFCEKFLAEPRFRRTVEQMEQVFDSEGQSPQAQTRRADRSGKQNIVEASLEKSLKSNIKLTGVARGSYGELLEDFKDFLRLRNLPLWDKNDPRVLEIRRTRISPDLTNLSHWSNWTNSPESFANLMITLISRQNYLLDQMLRSLERKFVEEGGYSENLTKKRLAYLSNKSNLSHD